MFQGKPTQDQQEQSSNHTPEKRTQDLQDQADQSPHTKVIFFLIPNCNSHFIMQSIIEFYINIHFIFKYYNYR